MEFKNLVKNTSVLAITRLFEFIAGFIRIKIAATTLGVNGIAILDQLVFFSQKVSTFTLLSMSEAVVKQISENKNSEKSSQLIKAALKSYILLSFALMFLSLILIFLFREKFAMYIFGNSSYIEYVFIAMFALPFLIINSIPFSILKAFKNIITISKARIYIVFINLIVIVPSIYFYELDGALYSVPLTYLNTFIINYYFAKKIYFSEYQLSLVNVMKTKMEIKFIKELFIFSGFGISVGLYFIVSEFITRGILISELGIDKIGLYSPIIMWVGLVSGIVLPSLSTYLYPRFCELKDNDKISSLLNDALRLATISLFPLLLIGMPFSDLFISIFYTKEFLEASKYVPFHFIGVIFYVWWYVFSQVMTPTGRIKQHGFFLICFYSLDILVTFIFVEKIGLYGWTLKFFISPFIFFIIYFFYCKINMNFILRKSNIIFMLYLLFTSLVLVLMNIYGVQNIFIQISGIVFFTGIVFFITEDEKKYIKERILKKRNKKK